MPPAPDDDDDLVVKEAIHSIDFLPDGSLMTYSGGAIKPHAINDQDLFIDEAGEKLTCEEMLRQTPSGGDDQEVFVDEHVISIDGVRMVNRNGRFNKI